jgi:hypothetical protein
MGRCGPGEHEGWVVPLFADGREGVGSSGSRGVLVQVHPEEWRPDADVIGWRAGCECGWRGPAWTRVASKALLPPKPTARLLAVEGRFADLDEADESRVMEAWEEHIAPLTRVEAVAEASVGWRRASLALDDAVQTARMDGASWTEIGKAVGITKQSAAERWGRLVNS